MSNLIEAILPYSTEVWSVVLVLLTALVRHFTRLKPSLIYSVAHAANLLVDHEVEKEDGQKEPSRGLVRMASITIQNSGLKAATNTEVTLNWKPEILNVLPARAFDEKTTAFDRYTLKFESIAPAEQITIHMMSFNAELPATTSVRCDESVAKVRDMTLQRIWPRWINIGALALLALGAFSAFRILLTMIGA